MPIGFDVNQPADLAHIAAAIAPYASQSAAESDIPTNAQDYLQQSYGRLTGDAFANPINDIFNARTQDRVNAISAARQLADVADVGPGPTGKGVPAVPSPMPFSQREAMLSRLNASNDAEAASYHLGSQELQLRPGAENYSDIQARRAAIVGATDLHNKILANDPNALSPTAGLTDPLFQRLAGTGKTPGKVVANEDLAKVANNPAFLEAYRQDPDKAKQYYSAVTGGRNFDTDREATIAQRKQSGDIEDKVLEEFRNRGKWNPVLGTFTLRKQVADQYNMSGQAVGGYKDVEEMPSDIQQAILDKRGLQSVFPSVDMSKFQKTPMPPGLSPDEDKQMRQLVYADQQASPGKNVTDSIRDVYGKLNKARQMADATAARANPRAAVRGMPAADTGQPDILDILSNYRGADYSATANNIDATIGNLFKRGVEYGVSRPVNFLSALMGSRNREYIPQQTPLYPGAPPMGAAEAARVGQPDIFSLLRSRLQAGQLAYNQ